MDSAAIRGFRSSPSTSSRFNSSATMKKKNVISPPLIQCLTEWESSAPPSRIPSCVSHNARKADDQGELDRARAQTIETSKAALAAASICKKCANGLVNRSTGSFGRCPRLWFILRDRTGRSVHKVCPPEHEGTAHFASSTAPRAARDDPVFLSARASVSSLKADGTPCAPPSCSHRSRSETISSSAFGACDLASFIQHHHTSHASHWAADPEKQWRNRGVPRCRSFLQCR